MTSEEWAQKFHIDYLSLLRPGKYFWFVFSWGKFTSTNQRYYPDLGGDTSSRWNFCACSFDIVSWENQRWRHWMSAFFFHATVIWFLLIAYFDSFRESFMVLNRDGCFLVVSWIPVIFFSTFFYNSGSKTLHWDAYTLSSLFAHLLDWCSYQKSCLPVLYIWTLNVSTPLVMGRLVTYSEVTVCPLLPMTHKEVSCWVWSSGWM